MDIMEQTWRHGAGNGVVFRMESIGTALPTNYRAKREKDKEKDDNNQHKKKPTPGAKHLGTQKKNRKKRKKKKKEPQGQKVNKPKVRPPQPATK